MAFFDLIKEKSAAIISAVITWFRRCLQIVRLSGELRSIDGEIRRRYEDLGRTIYESKGEDMGACREICDRIDGLKDRQEELTRQDVVLRSRRRCAQCGTMMGKQAKFCSACGASMPEASESKKESTEE